MVWGRWCEELDTVTLAVCCIVARITEGSLFVSRVGNTASYIINTSVEEMHNTRGNSVSTRRIHQY